MSGPIGLYPSSNEWGVPDLLTPLQPSSVTCPVVEWGTVARTTFMPGTWTFYADDYRFRALLNNPLSVLKTGCVACVEPNITLYEQSPPAEVIWATYRKRWVARTWQANGIKVFVDLNTPATHRDLCMIGVPPGWRAFATRAYASRLEALEAEWTCARSWAGEGLILLVYGGSRPARDFCRTLPGAVWIPSAADERRCVAAFPDPLQPKGATRVQR